MPQLPRSCHKYWPTGVSSPCHTIHVPYHTSGQMADSSFHVSRASYQPPVHTNSAPQEQPTSTVQLSNSSLWPCLWLPKLTVRLQYVSVSLLMAVVIILVIITLNVFAAVISIYKSSTYIVAALGFLLLVILFLRRVRSQHLKLTFSLNTATVSPQV